ncbi:kinesin-like protein KIF9 isoform X3 [Micropterus dolomieu]|uniref:kinesin-like protein KIF9 isoform X3 n=1 Tax=Micropterus dolomieu TaxID=147949 RepID=UPI001E8E116C|nr:kinesin-like protein KIF9 isoform X3 [Micropterus dolomieu]XP_045913298.1 kinesin-like protein KIF9 isoform X3 [Micropterus dolomieu]XP_045913372.1 kinesin-like protein KIF9 isoform X3 [Micropterus dolomieu]XP_045913455.1 kinesin-like protein KIF9 isoform X3 [Micropterus dolomieu]
MKAHNSEVGVFVRVRPTANFAQDLIECLPDGQTVNICHRKTSRKPRDSNKSQLSSWSFQVEGVLQDVSQEEFYNQVCRRVVLGALDGYNGSVMCFGQTGAGKTYTMTGSTESYKQRGVIPRALQEVFQEVEKRTEHAFTVHLSYLEIYNETLVDLLPSLRGTQHPSPRGMVVTEEPGRGVFIRGLSLHPVHSEEEALNLLFEGEMNRIIGSHALNRNSSRSHCIFTVHIESRSRTLSDSKYITSKLNLVDLAGSERLRKTGSEGQMLKEAVYINKSLSFLEQAILALADRRRDHVPFRQSKLTHALKDSLGGNCNTVLVANIYGEAARIEETLSTLRFAGRMKCLRADPAVNEHMDPAAMIKKLQKDVQTLKEELSLCNTLVNRPSLTCEPLSDAQLAEIHSHIRRYLEGSLDEISIISIRQVQAAFAQFKLAVQEQEQKVKAQLCQTYNLVKKDQSANTTAVKEWDTRGSAEDGEAVSFGVPPQSLKNSQRPSSVKAKTKKPSDKQSQSKRLGEGSPVPRKRLESASKSKVNSVQTPERESQEPDTESQDTQESQPPGNEPLHPDFPSLPSSARAKEEAFEDFKVGQGSQINRIFKENKTVLLERRSLLRQLTEEVNTVKRDIDCTMATIQQHKEIREGQGQYLVVEGEPLLLEPDAPLLMQLRELKALYRQRYEVLRDIKAEVNYCQHLVDQCRLRLLSEFENWYKKFFLVPEEELDITMEKTLEQDDGAEERLAPGSPSAESFYNTHHRTQKRRNSRAQRNSSGQRRPPIPPVT